MSSSVRMILNGKRIATGKPWKSGFLQVYPEQKTFGSEAEWRSQMYKKVLAGIQFESSEEQEHEDGEVNTKNQVVVPNIKIPRSKDIEESQYWVCGHCAKGSGADHRKCICEAYNYSAKAWEDDRVFTKKSLTENVPISLNPKDWSHKEVRAATLPPGTYYIGDLCYALDDTLYDRVFGADYDSGLYTMTDNPSHLFWLDNTSGDGQFYGSDGKAYAVDAGILGIASESTLDPKKKPFDGGHLYTFKTYVKVGLKNDTFYFKGLEYPDPNISIPLYEDETYEDSE